MGNRSGVTKALHTSRSASNAWLNDVEGNLERPVAGSRWEVPDVLKLDGQFLYWEAQCYRGPERARCYCQEKSSGCKMLQSFVELENADERRILAYAQRWGVLHTRPLHRLSSLECQPIDGFQEIWVTWHNRVRPEHDDVEAYCKADHNDRFSGREPLCVWRYWARRFGAALNVGNALAGGTRPELTDWEIMTGIYQPRSVGAFLPSSSDTSDSILKKIALKHAWMNGEFDQAEKIWHEMWELKVKQELALKIDGEDGYRTVYIPFDPGEHEAILLAWDTWRLCHPDTPFSDETLWLRSEQCIHKWRDWAGVGIGLDFLTRKLEVQTNTLFAGLVFQLMAAFGRCAGLAVCECGETFRPKRNQRFCPKCRKKGVPRKREREETCVRVREHRMRKKASSTEGTNLPMMD
jgi:hypothetical protein